MAGGGEEYQVKTEEGENEAEREIDEEGLVQTYISSTNEDGDIKSERLEEEEDTVNEEEGEMEGRIYEEEEMRGMEEEEEEEEEEEGDFLLLLPPDPESDSELPAPPSSSLQDRVIHIQASPDSAKPAVTGLRPPGAQAHQASRQEYQTVFLCPEPHCKLRLPTQASVATHVATCHGARDQGGEGDPLAQDLEELEEELEGEEAREEGRRRRARVEGRSLECPHCGLMAGTAADLRKHTREEHEEAKAFQCSQCNIRVSRKYHLLRHIKAVHQKEKFWQCDDCDYKTNNQVCFKKHRSNKHEGEDCDTVYSVDSLALAQGDLTALRCVCTWCPFKSSKYSVVKKHIEIHHERKHHYPCRECVFVGQSVDDYAEHYHTFHKMDEYRHACTDCSFKCTNKHDLKVHYSETHSKQRLYVCKMCDHKSNDVNNMKRHINTVHSTGGARRMYRCDQCDYTTELKSQLLCHRYTEHEGLGVNTEDKASVQQVKITLYNANSGDES